MFSMCHSCPDEDESDKAAGSKKRTKSSEADQRTTHPQRKDSKCEHGQQHSKCKECGGNGVCIHGRRHRECNECGGAAICQHGRRRERCKECHENSYGGCTVSHEVNSLQGKVVACGSAKHWIHYTDGSTRQLSTKELSLAVQPIGTTQSTSAHSQHQHTVNISTQSTSDHM